MRENPQNSLEKQAQNGLAILKSKGLLPEQLTLSALDSLETFKGILAISALGHVLGLALDDSLPEKLDKLFAEWDNETWQTKEGLVRGVLDHDEIHRAVEAVKGYLEEKERSDAKRRAQARAAEAKDARIVDHALPKPEPKPQPQRSFKRVGVRKILEELKGQQTTHPDTPQGESGTPTLDEMLEKIKSELGWGGR